MRFCSKCNRGLDDMQSYCPDCGALVPEFSVKKWVFLSVGFVAIVAIVFLVFGNSGVTGFVIGNLGNVVKSTLSKIIAGILVLVIAGIFVLRKRNRKKKDIFDD